MATFSDKKTQIATLTISIYPPSFTPHKSLKNVLLKIGSCQSLPGQPLHQVQYPDPKSNSPE